MPSWQSLANISLWVKAKDRQKAEYGSGDFNEQENLIRYMMLAQFTKTTIKVKIVRLACRVLLQVATTEIPTK
jgi:hypothetical protein